MGREVPTVTRLIRTTLNTDGCLRKESNIAGGGGILLDRWFLVSRPLFCHGGGDVGSYLWPKACMGKLGDPVSSKWRFTHF